MLALELEVILLLVTRLLAIRSLVSRSDSLGYLLLYTQVYYSLGLAALQEFLVQGIP